MFDFSAVRYVQRAMSVVCMPSLPYISWPISVLDISCTRCHGLVITFAHFSKDLFSISDSLYE